jgi:hypothetical protein
MPALAIGRHLGEDAPGEIVLVPARLDQHDAPVRPQPRQQIGFVPLTSSA